MNIKPCIFCKHTGATINKIKYLFKIDEYQVVCPICKACGPVMVTKELAIKSWNYVYTEHEKWVKLVLNSK